MPIKTFTPADKHGQPQPPVPCRPVALPLACGATLHAVVHRQPGQPARGPAYWRMSDPVTGAMISDIHGRLAGLPCRRRYRSYNEAVNAALAHWMVDYGARTLSDIDRARAAARRLIGSDPRHLRVAPDRSTV